MEIYFVPLIGVVFLLCMPYDLLFTFGNLRNSLWAHSPELDLYRRTQITIILVLVTCILGICGVWVFVNFSVYRGGVTSLEPVIPSPLCLQLCSLSNVWTNARLGTQQPPQCIIGFSRSLYVTRDKKTSPPGSCKAARLLLPHSSLMSFFPEQSWDFSHRLVHGVPGRVSSCCAQLSKTFLVP